MHRRLVTLALMIALAAAGGVLARSHRQGQALAEVYCQSQFDDAMREAHKLRGRERKHAEDEAHRAFTECKKKARKALQAEDVMPRIYPR